MRWQFGIFHHSVDSGRKTWAVSLFHHRLQGGPLSPTLLFFRLGRFLREENLSLLEADHYDRLRRNGPDDLLSAPRVVVTSYLSPQNVLGTVTSMIDGNLSLHGTQTLKISKAGVLWGMKFSGLTGAADTPAASLQCHKVAEIQHHVI